MSNVAIFALMIQHKNHVEWITHETNRDILRISKVKTLSPIAKELVVNRLKWYFHRLIATLQDNLEKDVNALKQAHPFATITYNE